MSKNFWLIPDNIYFLNHGSYGATPRLVACLHGGYPTKERYIGSTVFVDQASDFSYIYHHTSLNSAQTVPRACTNTGVLFSQ